MFLQVCVCPQGGGCLPQCMLGCHTPPRTRQTPQDQADPLGPGRPPWDQADPPRTKQTPLQDQADTPRDQADPPGTRQTARDQADTPWDQADTPPGTRETPPVPGRHPPWTRQTPLEADSSIQSTSSWYASYWNAFLCYSSQCSMSGYHTDTPITIKAEAIHEADSRIH